MAFDWVAVDWGTSRVRAWPMRNGAPLTRLESESGMSRLSPEDYEPALLDLLGDHLPKETAAPVDVLCCGMAGARQGWVEAPYASAPCAPPDASEAVRAPTRDGRLSVAILPGVMQASPADVMRGEETQIAGALEAHPGFDGVICLPGTHTKWARASAGEIVSFKTFMTGETFSLLSSNSVLRHSVTVGKDKPAGSAESADSALRAGPATGPALDQGAFADAVDRAMSHPAFLGSDLFALRAESLLDGLSPATARARLSGLLVGLELAGARPYWLGQRVLVVGESANARVYAQALALQGLNVETAAAEEFTLRGLAVARDARDATLSAKEPLPIHSGKSCAQ